MPQLKAKNNEREALPSESGERPHAGNNGLVKGMARMSADHFQSIEKFESELWKIADDLRANSGLASNEYFMPIMGLIFLRHATNRFYEARDAIEADKAAGRMPNRPLIEADFTRRRALMLPEVTRFDVLLKMPKDGNLGAALTAAMDAIEAAFPPLAGQLP
jgi:type I restriction enzyme M protein